jgi:hypothetical protein
MLALLRALGLPMVRHASGLGQMAIEIDLYPDPVPHLSARSRSGVA